MINSSLVFETEAKKNGFRFVLGVDEAGRGPLAGPVVAAAVYLISYDFHASINDSKKMTEKARLKAFDEIFERGVVGIGMMSEVAIDQVNILNASYRAMEEAVKQLVRHLPENVYTDSNLAKDVLLLIDGNSFRSALPFEHKAIIEGDAQCLSIACASIIAKVYRDRIMRKYDGIYPQYGFAKHKGYPTKAHRQAISQHGPSVIHRKSFTLC